MMLNFHQRSAELLAVPNRSKEETSTTQSLASTNNSGMLENPLLVNFVDFQSIITKIDRTEGTLEPRWTRLAFERACSLGARVLHRPNLTGVDPFRYQRVCAQIFIVLFFDTHKKKENELCVLRPENGTLLFCLLPRLVLEGD